MELTTHIAGTGADVTVQRLDESGTSYRISGFNTRSNPLCVVMSRTCKPVAEYHVSFQSGALQEKGRNGIMPQALLAVVLDHLGLHGDHYSLEAFDLLDEAMALLKKRAQERVTDGIDPIEAPCPCAANDKKCSAPFPEGKQPKTPRKP